jgi:transcription-repair coupling factor (superfamily II helicase)
VLFEAQNSIDPGTVVKLIQKQAREYRLEGPLKLRITRPLQQEEQRFEFAAALLQRLSGKGA